MAPRLNARQNQTRDEQQVAIQQLRSRVAKPESERQNSAYPRDHKYLDGPRQQVIDQARCSHFFLRFSLSSLLISSSSSGLILLSSTRCTSSGLAEPLK